MSHRSRGVAAATLVLVLGACGTTTVESGPSTTAVGATTTAPTGTVEELLGRFDERIFHLGLAIVDGEGAAVLDEIDALWNAIVAQLPRTEFVDKVDHQVGLMRTAVARRRAADADKAARNISALIAAR